MNNEWNEQAKLNLNPLNVGSQVLNATTPGSTAWALRCESETHLHFFLIPVKAKYIVLPV